MLKAHLRQWALVPLGLAALSACDFFDSRTPIEKACEQAIRAALPGSSGYKPTEVRALPDIPVPVVSISFEANNAHGTRFSGLASCKFESRTATGSRLAFQEVVVNGRTLSRDQLTPIERKLK